MFLMSVIPRHWRKVEEICSTFPFIIMKHISKVMRKSVAVCEASAKAPQWLLLHHARSAWTGLVQTRVPEERSPEWLAGCWGSVGSPWQCPPADTQPAPAGIAPQRRTASAAHWSCSRTAGMHETHTQIKTPTNLLTHTSVHTVKLLWDTALNVCF